MCKIKNDELGRRRKRCVIDRVRRVAIALVGEVGAGSVLPPLFLVSAVTPLLHPPSADFESTEACSSSCS